MRPRRWKCCKIRAILSGLLAQGSNPARTAKWSCRAASRIQRPEPLTRTYPRQRVMTTRWKIKSKLPVLPYIAGRTQVIVLAIFGRCASSCSRGRLVSDVSRRRASARGDFVDDFWLSKDRELLIVVVMERGCKKAAVTVADLIPASLSADATRCSHKQRRCHCPRWNRHC